MKLGKATHAMVHRPGCNKPDTYSCDCGMNVGCRTCMWGHATVPCRCYSQEDRRVS